MLACLLNELNEVVHPYHCPVNTSKTLSLHSRIRLQEFGALLIPSTPTNHQENQARYQQPRSYIGKCSTREQSSNSKDKATNRKRQSHYKNWLFERLIHRSIPFKNFSY